jgi:hypothetical protein
MHCENKKMPIVQNEQSAAHVFGFALAICLTAARRSHKSSSRNLRKALDVLKPVWRVFDTAKPLFDKDLIDRQ